ncbi:amino acid adenylation domain-containing protein [Nocardia wallacei]|uniref:amino acid adenylation domain-containing protein n=1 Tax=Nocardia wallacei TaxID=480035 RepID=UPI002454CA91|nr:amino acid adenylation domain-containing protein [Nocardia wallacei]
MLTVRPGTESAYPLSRAQWSWWLAQQLYPDVPVTVALYLDLEGPLDLGSLAGCARRAARELESPHLRFCLVDGYPRQYLDAATPLPLETVDLTGEADPLAAALDRMERDHGTPLDPLTDVLTVAIVFAVTPTRHLLYLRSHHIVLDGVGAAAVLRRTAQLYRAQVAAGRDAEPPDAGALSIAQILEDERAYHDSTRARADGDYWRAQLAGFDGPTGLAGRPAPPAGTPHHVAGALDEAAAGLLADAQARHGATFPELVIAAFACHLARMTGRSEVTFTMPVPARATVAARRSAGTMSNVVPLRLTGLDVATVGEVIAQVRAKVIGALRHQRYRHEDMWDGHEAVLGGFGPVLNVLGFVEPLRLGPVVGQARLLALGPVPDLQINGYQAGPDERSVSIDFQANPARYGRDALARHHRRFLDFFRRYLAAGTDCPATEIDLPAKLPQVAPPGPARLLRELLSADPAPDAVAVRDGDRTMTYREMDEAACRWARELLARGAGPGRFVAVAVARSLESVLALWVVARTGACYVPVDPADPPSRIAAILTDCRARLGITVSSVLAELPSGLGAHGERDAVEWLVFDDPGTVAAVERHAADPVGDAELPAPVRMEHPAYVIYTSGTTGTPKGVVVAHRGLGPLTDYLVEHYGLGPDSVLLHSHTATFDAHLLELLAAFAAGARLVVAAPEVVAGPALARLIRDSGCTVLQTAPAVLATLSPEQVPGLAVVAVGGEACPAKLVRQWAPHVRLHNGYGPTEATIIATETAAMAADAPVTIGRPLPGVFAAVLDARLRPVPEGARGELYLGGPAVAAGYLGNPAGTAARFVADPFAAGRRLYRTGDLVCAGPGGDFEIFGRLDCQIQLHGRRVEPAEIEAALLAAPEVAYAVVTLTDAGRPGARLAGYVVPADGARIDTAALLRRLRAELPFALVPSALVALDALPMAGNGKVDRAALPAPVPGTRAYRPPRTGLEQLVADRFAAVLDRSEIGRDDDFFELGGNSVLGVTISAELAAATGLPMALHWLYTAPTVELLAARLAGHDTAADDALGVLLPLRRNGTRPPLFCVHSAVPLAWCYAGLARYVTDRPVYGLQAPVLTAAAEIPATIDDLADSYIDAMLSVQPEGPYHLLGWSLGGQIAHAVAVRLRARGAAVAVLAMLDSVVVPASADPPPVPRMRDLLTHLLGDEPEDADAAPDVTAAEAAAELARAGASFGTGLSADQLERLHRGYAAGVALSHGYRPGVYDGDLLYFSATRGITELLGAYVWRPYVTGELVEHPVAATHAQLTNSEVVAVIGPLLADHLERTAATESALPTVFDRLPARPRDAAASSSQP